MLPCLVRQNNIISCLCKSQRVDWKTVIKIKRPSVDRFYFANNFFESFEMTEHIILGNGVAGIKAAGTIRNQDSNCKITVIGDEEYPFYYRPQLPAFVAGKIEEGRLWGEKGRFLQGKQHCHASW